MRDSSSFRSKSEDPWPSNLQASGSYVNHRIFYRLFVLLTSKFPLGPYVLFVMSRSSTEETERPQHPERLGRVRRRPRESRTMGGWFSVEVAHDSRFGRTSTISLFHQKSSHVYRKIFSGVMNGSSLSDSPFVVSVYDTDLHHRFGHVGHRCPVRVKRGFGEVED